MTTTTRCGCGAEAQTSPTILDEAGHPICDACIGDPGTLATIDRLRARARDGANDPRVSDAPQAWVTEMLRLYCAAVPMPAEPNARWWAKFHRFCEKVNPLGWALFVACCEQEQEESGE